MKNLYAIVIPNVYIRDTQIVNPDELPNNIDLNTDEGFDYIFKNDCWEDVCAYPLLIDFVRASSTEEALDCATKFTRFDKRILDVIQIGEV